MASGSGVFTALGAGATSLFGALAPLVGIIAAIGGAFLIWKGCDNDIQKQVQSAKEAGTAWTETNKSLNDYKDRVTELRSQLDSGTLSDQEAYQAKSELLSIQESLADSYGSQADGIDLVNGSLREQLELMNQLSQSDANKYLNENQKGIDKATKEMEKKRQYFLGQYLDTDDPSSDAIKKAIKASQEKYGNLITTQGGANGETYIYFKGDASQAEDVLNDFMTDVRTASDEIGDSNTLDNIFNYSEDGLNKANKILEKYQEVYDQAKAAEIAGDTKKYKGNENESKTAAEWMNDYSKAVEQYNEALSEGDSSKIAEAKSEFDSVNESVQSLLGSDMSKYADSFNEIGSQLNTAAIGANEFKDAINGVDTSDSAKGIAETAKELKELDLDDKDFVYAFETDGVQDGEEQINSLVQAALDAGVISDTSSESLQSLADMLIELGIVSGEPAEGMQQTTASIDEMRTSAATLVDGLTAVQTVLSSQQNGKSVSLADFNSDELKDYRNALEYVNGTMQLNAEKVREISKEKAKEQIATNNTNKALEQSKYLENARQIEEYRQKLRDSNFSKGETAKSVKSAISALLSENSTIADTCAQYDLLSASIEEATGAYQHWLNSQGASDYGDMANDAVSAIQQIRDTYDSNSDIYQNFGSKKFEAAVDFIVPDSVDSDDLSAIESYMANFKKYLKFDDDGVVEGLDIDKFLKKSVDAGLMSYGDDDGFKVLGGKKMEDFAEGLNLSSGVVQAFFDELQLKGAKFDWEDESVKTVGDLAVEANEAAESLHKIDKYSDFKIKMDVSDISDTDDQISALDATIAEMDEIKADPKVDTSSINNANAVIQYCLTQKQLLSQPDVMRVDTSQVTGEIGNAISLLQQFQNATNDLEIKQKVGADTTEAESEVNSLASKIQNLSPDVKAKLNIDSTSIDSIKSSITALSAETINVKAKVDAAAIDGYNPETKKCDVVYNPKTDLLPNSFKSINRTVNYVADTKDLPSSFKTITRYVNYVKTGIELNGTAHAGGTAKVGGDWGTAVGGTTLVGELGREIVVDPRTGRWYTVGDNGAEFRDIPAGAIVFNHLQTEQLLKNGYVSGRASALVSGTAFVGGNYKSYTPSSSSTTRKDKKSSTTKKKKTSSSSSTTKKKTSSSDDKRKKKNTKKDTEETFDFIEIAIDRVERAIDKLKNKAESVYKSFGTRNKKIRSEISSITSEIKLQQSAYNKYIKKAASVGLDKKWKKKVKNGSLNISEIKDEKLAKKIKSFQEWYEKALACKDTISELNEELASLYEDRFNNTVSRYDGKVSLLDHKTNAYQNDLDILVAKGYKGSKTFYNSLAKNEEAKIKARTSELSELQARLSDAMNSGKIKEGSQAWYDMQQEINSVKEAIQDAKLATINFNKEARELDWDFFEFMEDRISNITKEADFVIDLMSNKKMYDDKTGNITDAGMATMGLHSQNYNVYMAQADQYAEEIKSLNKEIAKDPYNTDLIKHREELLELQRESILSAEDEKQAISDLVEDGINSQLDALKELIDTYTDSLDSAKDLYDYQKKIKDQTSDIASLQKRLAAYSGDTSEESKATIQKIKVDLADAMDELQDTEYDKYISDQKELLDDLYNEYETVLNQRLDNIDSLITDVIKAVNDNSGTIGDTISEECENAGYTLSESMESIWNNEGSAHNVVSMYGEKFLSNGNATLEAVRSIQQYITSLRNEADAEASKDVSSVTERTSPTATKSSTTKKKTSSSSKSKKSSSSKGTQGDGKVQVGDKVTYKSGKYYSSSSGASPTGTKNRGKSVYITKINSKGSKPYHISTGKKLGQGDMGWLTKSQISGYARGLRRAKNDEYAWINELSPESIISPTKRAIITHIDKNDSVLNGKATDNIWSMANNPSEFIKNALNNDDINISNDDIENLIKGVFSTGYTKDIMDNIGHVNVPTGMKSATNIGDINYEVNIPIEHVSDYNDFMNQMKKDGRFEKMIQSMTVDRLVGGSKLSKNKFHW